MLETGKPWGCTHTHTHTHTRNFRKRLKRIYFNKQEKGITLIALVITIVVLLILAGVTIALVLGNNGMIKRAQESKEQTAQSQNKEMEDLNNLENYMNDKIGKVSADGVSKAPETYYGKEVKGYKLPSGTTTDVKWKIFYADGSNIYLIADKYVEKENLPNSTTAEGTPTENKPNDGNSSYARAAYFINILGDYSTGSARITDSKLQALNNDYFTKKYTSTNNNMKSVAYMMDTNAWNSKFKDVNKAEYVIGGPTVELLFKSYNDKYKTTYESQASSDIGYQIRKTSNDTWVNSIPFMLSTSDSLYVIKEQTDAVAYWLASPSADGSYLMYVNYNGRVGWGTYSSYGLGFRPLVCLKSDIQLQKNKDGTYTIL